MSDLSPDGRALLRRARADFSPSGDERERVASALAAKLGVGLSAVTHGGASAAPAGSTASSTAGAAALGKGSAVVVGAKCIGAVLLVSAIGAGGVSVYRNARGRSGSAAHPVVESPAPPVDSARAPTREVHDELPLQTPPVVVPTPAAKPRSPVHAVAPPRGDVAEETRLLREADRSLHNGNAARALELLDEHARRFPSGVLAEERSAERVTTLCQLGHNDDARDEAARFLRKTPDSPLAESVQRSCAAPPATDGH